MRSHGKYRGIEALLLRPDRHGNPVAERRSRGNRGTAPHGAAVRGDEARSGVGKQRPEIDARQHEVRVARLHGKGAPQQIEEDLPRRRVDRRVERGDAHRLPQLGDDVRRLVDQQRRHRDGCRTAKAAA